MAYVMELFDDLSSETDEIHMEYNWGQTLTLPTFEPGTNVL